MINQGLALNILLMQFFLEKEKGNEYAAFIQSPAQRRTNFSG
jgi:hypothetical protein